MDTYLSIHEASKLARLSMQVLNELALNGKIKSIMTTTGEILVSEKDVRERVPLSRISNLGAYEHLKGISISISEASRKYSVVQSTISRWVARGYIDRLGQEGRKVFIDEAQIAMYANIYNAKNGGQGKWIFDKDGLIKLKKESH